LLLRVALFNLLSLLLMLLLHLLLHDRAGLGCLLVFIFLLLLQLLMLPINPALVNHSGTL